MRRFDAYLAEKLSDPEFAKAFWDAEAELSLHQQLEQIRSAKRLTYEELVALPKLRPASRSEESLLFPTLPLRSTN